MISLRQLAVATLLLPVIVYADMKAIQTTAGLSLPVAVIANPIDPAISYVVQQRGRVKTLINSVVQPFDFLNLVGTVSPTGSERGLLGLAFDPNFDSNGYVYVNYTAVADGSTRIVRYQVDAESVIANPGTAYPILSIDQPFQNHNGGTMKFGPDGYLYIGMGDGGDGYDPGNRAQTIVGELLGKFLRIDITHDDFPIDAERNYAIPPTNPFVGLTGEDEIWAIGLRNPWKFAFDDPAKLGTGGLIFGDVGQELWEEVDYQPANAGGRNYGWRQYEGFVATGRNGDSGIPRTWPIWVYSHSIGQSITGGMIYRGTSMPEHFGRYIFADFITARVWSAALRFDANDEALPILPADVTELTSDLALPTDTRISSIDADADGELTVASYAGRIFRLLPENESWITGLTSSNATIEGGLRHLMLADGQAVEVNIVNGSDTAAGPFMALTAIVQTDHLSAQQLTYEFTTAETGVAEAKCVVLAKSWKSGDFEPIGTHTLGTSMQSYFGQTSSKSLIRKDGRLEIRIELYPAGDDEGTTYELDLDRLRIRLN